MSVCLYVHGIVVFKEESALRSAVAICNVTDYVADS